MLLDDMGAGDILAEGVHNPLPRYSFRDRHMLPRLIPRLQSSRADSTLDLEKEYAVQVASIGYQI